MQTKQFIGKAVRGEIRRGKCSSVSFDGQHVYSYGTHYPLLIQLKTAEGPRWILNDRGYSSSTGRHISWAREYADASVHIGRASCPDAVDVIKSVDAERVTIAENIATLEKNIIARPLYAKTYAEGIKREIARNKEIGRARAIACDAIDYKNTIKPDAAA